MEEQVYFSDNHQANEIKDFQCPICMKYFRRKFTLEMHLLIHKGIKPHSCPFCGKSFRQKGTLMRHKALHSSTNLFHCSLCNRGFRQKNVFLHHLKHRHNVFTETLDRRKYRTELKDYPNIMNNLPPFVAADSTAIASSEKHLDAMLYETLNNTLCTTENEKFEVNSSNGLSISQENNECMTNDISSTSTNVNSQIDILDHLNDLRLAQIFKFECGLCLKLFSDYASYNQHLEEEHSNAEVLIDRKPIISPLASEAECSISINDIALLPEVDDPSNLPNNSNANSASPIGSPSKVTSSNGLNDDDMNLCIPCQQSFTTDEEFQCHVKTHVQSVLLGEVNSSNEDADLSTNGNTSFSTDSTFDNSSENDSHLDFQELATPSSCINDEEIKSHSSPKLSPLKDSKTKYSNMPLENNLNSSNKNQQLKNYSNSTKYKSINLNSKPQFQCPFCPIICSSEQDILDHAQTHGTYKLLKIIRSPSNPKDAEVKNNNLNKESTLKTNFPFNKNQLNQNTPQLLKQNIKTLLTPSKKMNKFNMQSKTLDIKPSFNLPTSSSKLFCKKCRKVFKTKIACEYHRQMHLPVKNFRCNICKRSFSTKAALLAHTRDVHLKTFQCDKCLRKFNYGILYNSHRERCLQSNNSEPLIKNGLNFPMIDIQKLTTSDKSSLIGVIPINDHVTQFASNGNSFKYGIPVIAFSHLSNLAKLPIIDSPFQ